MFLFCLICQCRLFIPVLELKDQDEIIDDVIILNSTNLKYTKYSFENKKMPFYLSLYKVSNRKFILLNSIIKDSGYENIRILIKFADHKFCLIDNVTLGYDNILIKDSRQYIFKNVKYLQYYFKKKSANSRFKYNMKDNMKDNIKYNMEDNLKYNMKDNMKMAFNRGTKLFKMFRISERGSFIYKHYKVKQVYKQETDNFLTTLARLKVTEDCEQEINSSSESLSSYESFKNDNSSLSSYESLKNDNSSDFGDIESLGESSLSLNSNEEKIFLEIPFTEKDDLTFDQVELEVKINSELEVKINSELEVEINSKVNFIEKDGEVKKNLDFKDLDNMSLVTINNKNLDFDNGKVITSSKEKQEVVDKNSEDKSDISKNYLKSSVYPFILYVCILIFLLSLIIEIYLLRKNICNQKLWHPVD